MVALIATIGLLNLVLGYAVACSLGLGPSQTPRWLCPIILVPPVVPVAPHPPAAAGAQQLLSPLVEPAGH